VNPTLGLLRSPEIAGARTRRSTSSVDLLFDRVASLHPSPIARFEMRDVAETELFECGQRPAAPATGLSMHDVGLALVELRELLGVVPGGVVDVDRTL